MSDRQLEFHFGAITHQHMLSVANASARADLSASHGGSIFTGAREVSSAKQSAKAVGKVKAYGKQVTPSHKQEQN